MFNVGRFLLELDAQAAPTLQPTIVAAQCQSANYKIPN